MNIYMEKATARGCLLRTQTTLENKTYYSAPLSACKELITVVWD